MSTTTEIKEGDFKLKKKPKMKKLGKKNEITKVKLVEPKVEKEETITTSEDLENPSTDSFTDISFDDI